MLDIAVPLLLSLVVVLMLIITFCGNGDYYKLKKENERLENRIVKLADDINVRSRESRSNWVACQRINNQNIMLNNSNNDLINANQKLTVENEKLRAEIKRIREYYRDIILQQGDEIRELKNSIYPTNSVSVSFGKPVDNSLFKCHCGSEEFVDIEDHEIKGVKNEPPFIECVVQCVKCGALHSFKEEVDSVSISKSRIKKST